MGRAESHPRLSATDTSGVNKGSRAWLRKRTARKDTSKQIESIRHKDKRANIPTEELRDFVADEELTPRTMLYPRDPSLDPQLVWKGKDEQDREDLAVPVVPIYIQEKIHPQAIIDALPRIEQTDDGQANLFADFNGLEDDFEKKVDFYSQKDDRQKPWSNRLILGDSLLVMTSLAEKEGTQGQGAGHLPRPALRPSSSAPTGRSAPASAT